MGTQVVVSVIDPDDVLLLKVVSGSGGGECGRRLADYLAETGDIDLVSVHDSAEVMGLGSVVVVGRDECYHDLDEDFSLRYSATFELRQFNPRCRDGGCGEVWLVRQTHLGSDKGASVQRGHGHARVPSLQYPADLQDMDVGIDLFRSGEMITVAHGDPKYYELLGRLYEAHCRVCDGDADWLGSKTFQQIAEGS